jgi:hypothetical protein
MVLPAKSWADAGETTSAASAADSAINRCVRVQDIAATLFIDAGAEG